MKRSMPEELEILLNGVADGSLTEADESRLAAMLRSDAEARRHYRQFMALHAGLMWDYAAAIDGGEKAKPSPQPERVEWWRSVWTAAAAIAVLAALAFTFLQNHEPAERTIAALDGATGAVSWSNENGALRTALASGAQLGAGTLLVESEAGSAQLRFHDGTALTLTGEGELSFSDAGQKRLTLRRGALTAQVQRQPAGRPLIIRTPTAEVEVLGTEFSLAADPRQTGLSVGKGNVRLRRLADGRDVEVKAQQSAVATLDAKAELRAQSPAMPPLAWQVDFSKPIVASKGEWIGASPELPPRLRAVPFVAGRRADSTPIVHYGIGLRPSAQQPRALVSLTDGSTLHVRCRMERPTSMKLFLSCRTAQGPFAGNFELPLPNTAPDANGWITVEAPLAKAFPVFRQHAEIGGTQVFLLLLHSIESDAGLEVAELSIQPGASSLPK